MTPRLTPEREQEIRDWEACRPQHSQSLACRNVVALLAEIDALRHEAAESRQRTPQTVRFLGGVAADPLPQRAWDLLRYARHFLADAKLITADEFGALVEGIPRKDGAQAARRLEDYDAVQRQAAADRARREWQPIETAPKDGTCILVQLVSGVVVAAYWDSGEWWLRLGGGGRLVVPLWWMPIPLAPDVSR